MKKVRSGLVFTLGLILISGLASAQTIDEIQVYDPNDGTPQSPYDGQSVTVSGTVYVEKGTYNGGTYHILGATGGISSFAPGASAVLGDIVSITGTVSTFSGEIQISSPNFVVTGSDPTLLPVEVTVDELLINPDFPELYGDYERVGDYVAVTGTVVATDFNGTGGESFFLGGTNADLEIYVDDTVIANGVDLSGIEIGDEYRVLGPVVNFNGAIEIKPRFQTDLIEDPTLPVIFNVNLENWVVGTNDPITVEAVITDDVGVASASVYYRDSDGPAKQGFSSVAMTNTGGNNWEGVIPAPHNLSQVDFYVSVTDAEDQTVTNPGSAPAEFYETAVGITSIYDMQFVDFEDEAFDVNPYFNRVVNVSGVITVGTSDFGGTTNSRFIVQEQEPGNDNTYKWGAVLVYEGAGANEYFRGDLVEVGGTGGEFNQLTELLPHNPSAINLLDFGQDLPPATLASTAALADTILGEPYESLWVRSGVAQVLAVDAPIPGSFIIADNDTSNPNGWLTVDPSIELTYIPTLGDILDVTGFMDAELFGTVVRDLVPIADEFVLVLDAPVGVEDGPTIQKAGGFRSVYPNPFNPRTQITFAVNKPNLCQLNVYNIRGEKVRTILQERLAVGDYELTWDGRNDGGDELASGTYFARLRIGAEVTQVRKLQLVK